MATNLTGCQVHNIEKIPFRMRVGRWNVRQFSSPSFALVGVSLEVSSFALSVEMELLFFLLILLVGQRRRRRSGFICVNRIVLGLGRTL